MFIGRRCRREHLIYENKRGECSLLFSPFFFHRTFFPYFFSGIVFLVLFSRTFFPRTFFTVLFFPYFFSRSFFLVVVQKCWLRVFATTIASYNHSKLHSPLLFSYIRCSLRRPRPVNIGNYPPPFYFHIQPLLK
jgi:hypothetical protein